METCVAEKPDISLNADRSALFVDITKPGKIPVHCINEFGKVKEYFLKVTERKGLVLV